MTTRSDIEAMNVRRARGKMLAVALVAAAIGLAAVYGIAGFGRNADVAACPEARTVGQRIAPLVRGEIAALTVPGDPQPLPQLTFNDANGESKTLLNWRQRNVLLNLWATWCVPCRKEMPALDALQAKLGSPVFEVVAINIDTRDPEKPKAWLRENGIKHLAYYADPSARVFQDLKAVGKAFGMPTTVLVNWSGCEVASLSGPAEWASDDAVKLVQEAIKP